MDESTSNHTTDDTLTAIEALETSDPADAPEIAQGIASGLQRELDREPTSRHGQTEDES